MQKEFSDCRILIIDDTVDNLQLLTTVLGKEGYHLHAARSGIDGMAIAEEIVPDLVLLDMHMPGLDGLTTCRAIKANRDLNHIPVIFVSADHRQDTVLEAFGAGAVDFISKPISEAEVSARVRTHLEIHSLKRRLHHRVAELEILYAQMRSVALRDDLTGLYNRRFINERLKQQVERDQSCAVALFDIDRFKQINDANSHQVGDHVIKVIAGLARSAFRQLDTVARWGGDEFLVVMPRYSMLAAGRLCDYFRAAVAAHNWQAIGVTDGEVTVSIGVAPVHGDAHAALAEADERLYDAKRGGRNRVVTETAPGQQRTG